LRGWTPIAGWTPAAPALAGATTRPRIRNTSGAGSDAVGVSGSGPRQPRDARRAGPLCRVICVIGGICGEVYRHRFREQDDRVTLFTLFARVFHSGQTAVTIWRMNWREHLRVVAILINAVFAIWLIGVRGWWWSFGLFGLPLIVAPLLAILALAVNSSQRQGTVHRDRL
jgi:hypothetical protein